MSLAKFKYMKIIYIQNKIQKLFHVHFSKKKKKIIIIIIAKRKIIIIAYKCLRIFTTTNFHAD